MPSIIQMASRRERRTHIANLAEVFPTLNASCVVLKDGFQTETDDHWEMMRRIRDIGGTLIASTEIHRLDNWRPGFDRILLLVEGKVQDIGVADKVRAELS